MSKASEKDLETLHGNLVKVFNEQVMHVEEETVIDEDGDIVPTGKMRYTAPPATLTAAAKFLKDNNCTADIKQDENLDSLATLLKDKQRHSRLASAKDTANNMEH